MTVMQAINEIATTPTENLTAEQILRQKIAIAGDWGGAYRAYHLAAEKLEKECKKTRTPKRFLKLLEELRELEASTRIKRDNAEENNRAQK
jgi:hypothetical protein